MLERAAPLCTQAEDEAELQAGVLQPGPAQMKNWLEKEKRSLSWCGSFLWKPEDWSVYDFPTFDQLSRKFGLTEHLFRFFPIRSFVISTFT